MTKDNTTRVEGAEGLPSPCSRHSGSRGKVPSSERKKKKQQRKKLRSASGGHHHNGLSRLEARLAPILANHTLLLSHSAYQDHIHHVHHHDLHAQSHHSSTSPPQADGIPDPPDAAWSTDTVLGARVSMDPRGRHHGNDNDLGHHSNDIRHHDNDLGYHGNDLGHHGNGVGGRDLRVAEPLHDPLVASRLVLESLQGHGQGHDKRRNRPRSGQRSDYK